MRVKYAFAVCLAFALPNAGAQMRQLRYEPELTIELARQNIARAGAFTVSRSGRIVMTTEQWIGQLIAFDSNGKKLDWNITTGRVSDSEIGWVNNFGWAGDSLWVQDRAFDQIVILAPDGKVVRSLERPNWVRPSWGDRRRYPLFSSMSWEAVYPNGDMLVTPERPRAIFDTPQYDRKRKHLLRTNSDGKILRTVAKIPAIAAPIELRDGRETKMVSVPYYPVPRYKVSSDGERVAIVEQPSATADSSRVRVTMLNAMGDTVFSRRYHVDFTPISSARADSLVTLNPMYQKPFGRYSVAWIRDTVRKLIPAWEPRMLNLLVGVDYSTWIWLRSDKPEHTALVIGPTGDLIGEAKFPPSSKLAVYSVDHIWTMEPVGRPQLGQFNIVRSKLVTTSARPARTASTRASRGTSKQPE